MALIHRVQDATYGWPDLVFAPLFIGACFSLIAASAAVVFSVVQIIL